MALLFNLIVCKLDIYYDFLHHLFSKEHDAITFNNVLYYAAALNYIMSLTEAQHSDYLMADIFYPTNHTKQHKLTLQTLI